MTKQEKIEKVKYHQKFYIVESYYFSHNFDDCVKCLRTEERKEFTNYQWVSEVFVIQLNKWWNGENTFDICPVDFSDKNNEKSWRWKREIHYKDIGEDIFNTEKEAWAYYKKRYDSDKRKIFKKLREIDLKHQKHLNSNQKCLYQKQ